MKIVTKITFLSTIAIMAAYTVFAQTSKQYFSQGAPANGSFIGKTIRSCFGGSTTGAKVIVVVNRADWCLICQKNSERVQKILPLYKQKPVAFVPNDLTDDRSKNISAKYLKKLHIYDAIQPIKETGIMILVNAKTHQEISKVSLASSDEEIENAIDRSLNIKG